MRALITILAGGLLGACGQHPLPPPPPGGELIVVTRPSSVTYYEEASGKPAGLEYELVEAFAARKGWRVRWLIASNVEQLLGDIREDRAHLAAAALTVTPQLRDQLLFGPHYRSVHAVVLRRVSGPKIEDAADLVDRTIEVVAGSSHVEDLRALAKRIPNLRWREVAAANAEHLLERLESGLVDAIVVDSADFDIGQNFYPELRVAFALGAARDLAWAFPRGTHAALLAEVEKFFEDAHKSGLLARLVERYFGHVDSLTEADVVGILEKRVNLLPRYRALFQHAEDETGIDWRLLAALGYQESKWNPGAVSPTGVRGLMMLTADTADHLGVKNRLDPAESTLAAARYFNDLRAQLPESVAEPDRAWLALAAYNIGMAHLNDARRLARRLGKNPDSWADMKTVLPLLSRPRHFASLAHGFARGGEATVTVENVRTYYDIMRRFERPREPVFGGSDFDVTSLTPY